MSDTPPPPIRLYSYAMSPYAAKVHCFLLYKKLPFECFYINPLRVRRDLPVGRQIPVLTVGSESRADSTPIGLWLDEIFSDAPRLLPRDGPERDRLIAIDDWVTNRLIPGSFRSYPGEGVDLFLNGWKLSKVMARTARGGLPLVLRAAWPLVIRRIAFVRRLLTIADDGLPVRESKWKRYREFVARLEGGPFVAGREAPSLPDFSAYPQFALFYATGFRGSEDILEVPELIDWLTRMRPFVEGDPPLVPLVVRERELPSARALPERRDGATVRRRMSERSYDPDLASLLPLLPPIGDLSSAEAVAESRRNLAALFTSSSRDDVVAENRQVPGPSGAPAVPVRTYRPVRAGDEALPCVFEIHGGGFIMGSIDMMEDWCQTVAADLTATVVSVEYRLAPENPFPAGLEDCYAALQWTADHAADLRIDPGRIAVAGQSAGGGLAAATALLCRDRGGPAVCFQLLEIPELDDRLVTPSMQEFHDTPMWNRRNAEWSWRHYLGSDHDGETSPYAAPARARYLAGLPPAYVSVMEFDPLRDEGVLYALALMQAGVQTELHAYPGTFHGSALFRDAAISKRSTAESFEALARAFSR